MFDHDSLINLVEESKMAGVDAQSGETDKVLLFEPKMSLTLHTND